ncbi:T9SS type A sorting domain-containing protein [bacterium]|nr:T9SS type A sorting domain-containing protein [bacterium]
MFRKIMILTFLLGLVLSFQLNAAERVVLGELITSTTCGPCLNANNALDDLRDEYSDRLVLIRYHVWWPSPGSDPFYHANEPENTCRTYYYSCSAVPDLWVDGTMNPSYSEYETYITAEMEVESPITLDIYIADDTIVADITVESGISSSSLKLYNVIIENNIRYNAPNGQTVFFDAMRNIIPGCEGLPINLGTPGEYTFKTEYESNPDWNEDELEVVVFVQEYTSHEVFQAARTTLPAMYRRFYTSADRTTALMVPDTSESFHIDLENNGYREDNFQIVLEYDASDGWYGNFVIDSETHETSHTMMLDAGFGEDITLNVYSPSTYSANKFYLIVNALLGEDSDTTEFVVSTGGPVLVIDNSGNDSTVYIYRNILDEMDVNYGLVNRDEGVIRADMIENYELLMWFTGDATDNTINRDDEITLMQYLIDDGNLFVSGENIADDLYSVGRTDFINNYLHASYLGETVDIFWVRGYDYDTLTGIFNFVRLYNTCTPDIIYPFDEHAIPIFKFGGDEDKCGGIRVDRSGNRIVFLPFGLENMMDEDDQYDLIYRVIYWMVPSIGIEEWDAPGLPNDYECVMCYPNPFNSEVTIEFDFPKYSGEEETMLSIFDIKGKLVYSASKALINEEKIEFRWNGLNLSGNRVPSGIYLVKIDHDGRNFVETLLVLR